ncbi:MAG: hypothetical protein AB8G77_04295 [Rhodothermales bacterium]
MPEQTRWTPTRLLLASLLPEDVQATRNGQKETAGQILITDNYIRTINL